MERSIMPEIDLSIFMDTYVSVSEILAEIEDEDFLPEIFDRWDNIKNSLISGLTKEELNDLLEIINDKLVGDEDSNNK